MSDNLEEKFDVLLGQMGSINTQVAALKETVDRLTDVVIQMARVEVLIKTQGEALERAFKEISRVSEHLRQHEETADKRFEDLKQKVPENLSTRLTMLEKEAPIGRLVNKWVLGSVVAIIGTLVGYIVGKLP